MQNQNVTLNKAIVMLMDIFERKTLVLLYLLFSIVLYANNIDFENELLEQIVKETLGIENRKITSEDIEKLVELKCYGSEARSLKGIEYAENLETLVFTNSMISDISAIEKLRKLKVINLSFNKITSLEPLRNHTNISKLYLNHNSIADISPLENLVNLELLALQKNPLSEESYTIYLPQIIQKNPNAIVYHDKVLTPEKALLIANKVFIYGLIFVCVLVISVMVIKGYRVSYKNSAAMKKQVN